MSGNVHLQIHPERRDAMLEQTSLACGTCTGHEHQPISVCKQHQSVMVRRGMFVKSFIEVYMMKKERFDILVLTIIWKLKEVSGGMEDWIS